MSDDSEKIAISDKKQVQVEFEDVDLLSNEEREALELDIDMDGPGETADADAEAKAAAEADEAAKAAEADKADKAAKAPEKPPDQKPVQTPDKTADPPPDDGQPPQPPASETPPAEGESEIEAPFIPPAPASTKNILSDEDLTKLEADMEANNQAFDNGELEWKDYLDRRDDLRDVKRAHETALENTGDGVQTQWEYEQDYYLSSPENAWILESGPRYAAFATAVNEIMSTDEGENMSGPQLLARAKAEVEKIFIAPGSPEAADQAAREAEAEAAKKAANLKAAKDREAGRQAPETLGGKPAAEIDEGVSEFEWLDKLDGEKYEEAIENMTEAQLARYEASI